ncbi:MAG: MFS transporter [Candidatus Sericytochromatia bacterium]
MATTGNPEMRLHSPYRWVVLAVFTVVAGLSQLLWLNFAPLLSMVQKQYGVSEFMASLLLLVFPLIYVFLSVPAGILIDKKGYRYSIGLGAVLMALFATLRIFDASFWALLIGQIGIAIAQPFVINGISKLVLDWFSEEQSAIATGLGTMGMFIGMAVGMALTPVLVEATGFRLTMVFFAVVSILSCVAFLALAKSNPAARPEPAPGQAAKRVSLADRNLLLLYAVSFLGLGFFNGLTTWLEPILAPQGIDAVKAGIIGAFLILGGIFGSVIIPGLSDRFKRRKPFLIGSTVVAGLTLYPLCTGRDFNQLLVLGALQGFFFLPAYALLLEMCSEVAGEVLAGSATGILMLTGNAGGVVVIMAMEAVKGKAPTFIAGVHLMMVTLVLAVLLSLLLSETFHFKSRPAAPGDTVGPEALPDT